MNWSECLYLNVKNYLKANNMKMGDLENKLGMSKGYLSRNVKSNALRVDVAINLCELLDTNLNEIVSKDIYGEQIKELQRNKIRLQIEKLQKELANYDNQYES